MLEIWCISTMDNFLLFPRWTATSWNLLTPLIALFYNVSCNFHQDLKSSELVLKYILCQCQFILRLTFTKWVSKIFVKCADVWPSSSHYFPQQIWIFLTDTTYLIKITQKDSFFVSLFCEKLFIWISVELK